MKTMKKIGALALAIAALNMGGCASLFGDATYPVSVNSSPDGATFKVMNKSGEVVHSGSTPGSVILKSSSGYFKGETYTIVFSKPGMNDQTVTLDSGISGWYWANILLGGAIGMLIVDPATGKMFTLPEHATGNLSANTAQADGKGKDLTMLTIDQVPESERASLREIH